MRNCTAVLACLSLAGPLHAQNRENTLPPREECGSPAPAWLFCDDFEVDRLGRYFEVNTANGRFSREAGAGVHGSHAMRGVWRPGDVNAGALRLAFGRLRSATCDRRTTARATTASFIGGSGSGSNPAGPAAALISWLALPFWPPKRGRRP
jgi:hypothetical protein